MTDASTAPNLTSFRSRFPILANKTYLNSCSQGALSTDVEAAYKQYLADWHEFGSPWDIWVDKLEETRATFANLIHAISDEVAVMSSVSAAVSAVASALDYAGASNCAGASTCVAERNRILVSDFEFPTVGQIWHAQERRGAVVEHVPADGNRITAESFVDAIDERTLLVSLTHVCYRNGAMLDVPAIVQVAHEHGALVLLDSFQTLGTMPVDVRTLDVDFLVGGALKYLLGPAGLAFLYVRHGLVEALQPTTMGWFSQKNIFAMDGTANCPSPTARRFESGTPPVPNLYAGLAGIQLLESAGIDAVRRHIAALDQALIDEAGARGYALATPTDPHAHGAMISFRSSDEGLLVDLLAREDIVVSSRDDNIRVSPHAYNNHDDIAHLLAAMDRHRSLLVTEG